MSNYYGGNHFYAAIFYGVISTSMAFLNKAVLNSYHFNFPFFIMACQMTSTIVCLEIAQYIWKFNITPFSLKSARSFLIPSIFYGLHATLSLIALEGLNIPMYTAIKRCTPLINLALSVVILKKAFPSLPVIISISTIVFGCVIAAVSDLSFDLYSYSIGGLSVLAQGLYLTLVQQSAEKNMSTLDILNLNSYNTLAPFMVLSCALGEPEKIVKSPVLNDVSFLITFSSLVILGSILNYSLFLCTSLNSALTTSLVGAAKSTLQSFIGFFTFGGVQLNIVNLIGILLNLFGGFLYIYSKYRENVLKILTSKIENGLHYLPQHLNNEKESKVKMRNQSENVIVNIGSS